MASTTRRLDYVDKHLQIFASESHGTEALDDLANLTANAATSAVTCNIRGSSIAVNAGYSVRNLSRTANAVQAP